MADENILSDFGINLLEEEIDDVIFQTNEFLTDATFTGSQGPFWWLLVVGVFLSILLPTTSYKPISYKILSRETNLKRDKNGTEPQENKIKNALLRISASEYLLHGYKDTILSHEKQMFAYKSLLHRRFAMLGILGKILQIPFSYVFLTANAC